MAVNAIGVLSDSTTRLPRTMPNHSNATRPAGVRSTDDAVWWWTAAYHQMKATTASHGSGSNTPRQRLRHLIRRVWGDGGVLVLIAVKIPVRTPTAATKHA